MNKKIVITEIDRLVGTMDKSKVVGEYLISVFIDYDRRHKIGAFIEYGNMAKQIRVNELIIEHFQNGDTLDNISNDMIKEISFEEYKKK